MTAIPSIPLKTASLNQAAKPVAASNAVKTATAKPAAGDDKFSFWDFLDIINPLQHIPVVSSIYREITGDKISNFSRIAGGALFGGFLGAAVGAVNAIAVTETGEDVGELAMTKIGLKQAPVPLQTADKTKSINTENIPVIEVRPSAEQIAKATHEKIIWDKPGDAASVNLAKAEQIIWDPAPKTAMAAPTAPAVKAPVQTAAALPDRKEINGLDPLLSTEADVAATAPQQVDKAQVPDAMLKALAKYQSIQHLGAPAETNNLQTGRKFAGLDKTVRRY